MVWLCQALARQGGGGGGERGGGGGGGGANAVWARSRKSLLEHGWLRCHTSFHFSLRLCPSIAGRLIR